MAMLKLPVVLLASAQSTYRRVVRAGSGVTKRVEPTAVLAIPVVIAPVRHFQVLCLRLGGTCAWHCRSAAVKVTNSRAQLPLQKNRNARASGRYILLCYSFFYLF